jgi:hypothetical protein
VRILFFAAIAQLDRASDYESEGLGFKSLWPYEKPPAFRGGFFYINTLRRIIMIRTIIFLLSLGLCFTVAAKNHHDDHDRGDDNSDHRGFKKTVVVEKTVYVERFSDNDRDVIVKYYDRRHKKIPPGQLKKMRHYDIVVGQPAAPEIFMAFAPLPIALVPLLPPPPPGVRLFVAGDQIVRVEGRSHRVLDCIPMPGIGVPPPLLPPMPR